MQKLIKLVEDFKKNRRLVTHEEEINLIREYLQVRVLQLIVLSKFGAGLSFMGGTCLRICYDLKRYSEDLDFALDSHQKKHHFGELIQGLKRELELTNFKVDTNVHEDKRVQKAFLKFRDLYPTFHIPARNNEKIHIKIEVDVHPVPIKKEERESFFVTRYGEIFPILKHTLPTLFAGKILAILLRPYCRGRDYYDLIWYLTKKTTINFRYLSAGTPENAFKNNEKIYQALLNKVREVQPSLILKDISRFLEDPSEVQWIREYPKLFSQLWLENSGVNPGRPK
ncbi:MAG: nucleotidyl transferase AbiEii/AbiGii toxin family protein [Elusimicrobia bacterium]|nr:nucleotidyl transferase AbiEii/AbiGii toxin family protein [Elusimicrobiota bacterium]